MTAGTAERRGSPLLYLSLLATAALAWMLCHPYEGLFHDADLYSLLALARLHPQALTQDVFLSHGSQDRFTVFSPLYAATISAFGIDRAAALLTFCSQLAVLSGAWIFIRQLMPRWAAAFGTLLLVALPGDYGPGRIFACLEPFLTPRMLAEGLTLAMLAAALRRRPLFTTLFAAAALALHPVMALAGPVTFLAYRIAPRGLPIRMLLLGGAALMGALGAVLYVGRFDAEWFSLIAERSPYLFLRHWSFDDATRAGVIVATLVIAKLSLPPTAARLSRAVLLTTLAGWALTLLGADLAHLVLLTQLQSWRWEWLGSATSALLLPYLLYVLWQSGARSVALAVGASWIFRDGSLALVATLAALALRLVPPLDARKERLLLGGATALLLLAATWRIASNFEFTDVHYMDSALPPALRRAMSFAKDGALIALLAGGLLLLDLRRARLAQWAALIALSAAAAVVLPFSASRWLSRSYPDSLDAKFEPWRALIPPHSEVLWNESPLAAWALLRRPNYISGVQTSGLVFSRGAAIDLKQRAQTLASVIPVQNFLGWSQVGLTLSLSPEGVTALCRLGVVPYLVTSTMLDIEPIARLGPQDWSSSHGLNLYRCSS